MSQGALGEQVGAADPRRHIPRVDRVLADPRVQQAVEQLGKRFVKQAVVVALEQARAGQLDPQAVTDRVVASLPQAPTGLAPVVNATGVLVHTNLGRAPLSEAAVQALQLAAGTVDVELDLEHGRRARRGRSALRALAAAVPDAEAVHVVNNGAAALALTVTALASGRTVVLARGELVEIGDGFRLPELIEAAGARIREVGTTNSVRFDDYERAVDDDVAFVLKVHTSNFRVSGFTRSLSVGELTSLPVPVVVDIGSGLLHPHPRLPEEPSAAHALRSGAALVTASGDKLLGGPQAGLMLGRAALIDRARRHPLARAVRVDKLTLAALEATLTGPRPPVAAALDTPFEQLMARAELIVARLADVVSAEVVVSRAAVGGGGAPGVDLPSAAITLPVELARPLRLGRPAIVGHVEHSRLLLDLFAVPATADESLVAAVKAAVQASVEGTR